LDYSIVTGTVALDLTDRILRVFKDNRDDRFEVVLKAYGRDLFYDFHCIPEKDEMNKVTSVLGVGRDITAYKELEIQLQDLAKADVLTGITNRRSFMERMIVEFASVKRYKISACLMMIEIDFFKRILDMYGLESSDKTLICFSSLVKTNLRMTDIFGRLSEEKFAVIVHHTPFEMVINLAERLRSVAEESIVRSENQTIKFTISIGITNLSKADIEVNESIERAEKALNEAKLSGRNRIANIFI
jgi:diguanylate cyclase (GGDEF)-like protein